MKDNFMLAEIPFIPDAQAVIQQMQISLESDLASDIQALAERAAVVANPKALFRECYLQGRGEDTVTVDGTTFTSEVLRQNLEGVERVFPYVVTCGAEFDALLAGMDDDLLRYCLDCIKGAALGAASVFLRDHLVEHYGLTKFSSMNPGSGDVDLWPIQQQALLFGLLGDVEGAIGVRLSDTFLMHPNKSISGIFFPTEVDFHSCQLCHRKDCPGRRAPFDEALWQEKHGGM
ncbi:MAG TPA: vitamin B12 dependent methionine synthase [Armatimonadota bacterium]